MTREEIAEAFDVHELLDRLAMSSPQDYYRVNHVPAASISELREQIISTLISWCEANGLIR